VIVRPLPGAPFRASGRRLLGAVLVGILVACGQSGASFDPASPCTADVRMAGAFPELERLVPTKVGDLAASHVDSGRSCTSAALSTYAAHGISELRFAGATWDEGGGNGTAIAIVATPPAQPVLEQDWVEEFYRTGALGSTKTENVSATRPTIDGTTVYRLETLNDLSLQTVLVWSANGSGEIHVVIVATQVQPNASRDAHNARVVRALAASKAAPA
jgi:hypothetical protein